MGAVADPIAIEHIIVRDDRVICDIAVRADCRSTDGEIARRACRQHPNLPRHACVNSKGDTFGAVIARTSMPHLLEHVVVDMLTERTTDERAVFVGTSEWTNKRAGKARVQVSLADDLAVLRAFRDAVSFINEEVIQ